MTPQAAGSREARLTGRKLQQLVHINLVTSPPGAWCVDRILFGIHDDHVDAGLRCAIIGAVGSLRALCLPTFSHFLNVTKPFLSLSLSLSLSLPVFFSPGWQVTCVSPYVRSPFPSKEIRRISERDNPGPPVVQLVSAYMALGFRESGFGNRIPENPVKRVGFFCFPIKHSTHTNMCPEGKRGLDACDSRVALGWVGG